MAGFTAAICHRGVRHIRVPTTVLSQNDSGVGVKNGVNAFGQKNFLAPSRRPSRSSTIPPSSTCARPRDSGAGMAEAVKVALIRDRSFFEWLEAEAEALARCASARSTS